MTETPDPYRFFRARVTAIADITPSFRRFTFGGGDLAEYGDPDAQPAQEGGEAPAGEDGEAAAPVAEETVEEEP